MRASSRTRVITDVSPRRVGYVAPRCVTQPRAERDRPGGGWEERGGGRGLNRARSRRGTECLSIRIRVPDVHDGVVVRSGTYRRIVGTEITQGTHRLINSALRARARAAILFSRALVPAVTLARARPPAPIFASMRINLRRIPREQVRRIAIYLFIYRMYLSADSNVMPLDDKVSRIEREY